ncbi:hypothetical protein OFO01_07130 [Campylobacter sp. JMF_01 NE2]|uniref:hypothetical protein n=1 Tax=unclassified Campylobacter TaxID=2593542 RepID=UPI0022EA0EC2|nr:MULTISPECIES: hypothetical protein [unclassified Campylobacter]MDA3053264.1 hypothetical protein [Campylobacter sp. JMF_03 NE3]MDA3067553.1 hypothetical protein [Campylobacter sp. JMF_01 NE2]
MEKIKKPKTKRVTKMITIPEDLLPLWDNLQHNKSSLIKKALLDCANDKTIREYAFKDVRAVEAFLKEYNKPQGK